MAQQIQAQWDIGASSFSLSDRLFSLVKAATVDDVQPMAVVAAEAIGSCLEVDPHLTGRAIDILNRSDSFRMENVKLTLGLSSGGIAREIRRSVPATRTFVLMTLLQDHLDTFEIASVLFEMLVHSGLHNKIATSRSQLQGLCNALQGHCNMLSELEEEQSGIWMNLLPVLAGISRPAFWESIVPEEGAKVILEGFRALRDEEVNQVTLRGSHGANWIMSLLSQMLAGKCDVADHEGRTIFKSSSHQKAKLIVQLDENCEAWSVETFYTVRNATDLLRIELDNLSEWYEAGQSREWPSELHRSTLYSVLLSRHGHMDQNLLEVIEISTLVILLLIQDSGIGGNRTMKSNAKYTKFVEICRPDFVIRSRQYLLRMGWPENPDNFQLASAIASWAPDLHDTELRSKMLQSYSMYDRALVNKVVAVIRELDAKLNSTGMTYLVYRIVQHLIMLAFSDDVPQKVNMKFEPRILDTQIHLTLGCWINLALRKEPYSRVYVSDLMRSTMYLIADRSVVLGGLHGPAGQPLAVTANGYIAYLSCIESPPSTSAEACRIVIRKGTMVWRDEPHKVLLEGTGALHDRREDVGNDRYDPFATPESHAYHSYKQATVFQIQRSKYSGYLNWFCQSTACGQRDMLYYRAIDNFLSAYQCLERPFCTKQVTAAYTDTGNFIMLGSIPNEYTNPYLPLKGKRWIHTYSKDPIADFLRYGAPPCDSRMLLIQNTASLQGSVMYALEQESENGWVIFANPR